MERWLVKEEREHSGYAQLERDRKTIWSGVRAPLTQKRIEDMRP